MGKKIAVTTEKTIREDMGSELFSQFTDLDVFDDDYETCYCDLSAGEKICILSELVEQFEQAVNEELEEIFKEAARG